MANNIKGFGKLGFRDSDNYWRPIRSDSFVIGSEKETEKVLSYPADGCGPLVAVDSKSGATEWTAGVGVNSIDSTDMELIFDQKWGTVTSISLPDVNVYTVPSATPYEVAIAGLTTADTVAATVLNDTGNTLLTVTTGAASATNAQKAAGKLVFDATLAGKSVSVYRLASQSNLKVLGGSAPAAPLGELELFGVCCTTRGTFKIWLPRLARNNGVNFDSGADTFELTYDLLTPSGFNQPYAMWQ
jgi:hypothetical protein